MPWLVLVVDDSLLIRNGVKRLFEAELDFEIAGEAEHGIEAIEKAVALRPHLIIIDFSMPVMNGLVAAPILLERLPEVRIIMLTMFSGDQMATSALKAGIHALIPKGQADRDLIPTVLKLFDGTPSPPN